MAVRALLIPEMGLLLGSVGEVEFVEAAPAAALMEGRMQLCLGALLRQLRAEVSAPNSFLLLAEVQCGAVSGLCDRRPPVVLRLPRPYSNSRWPFLRFNRPTEIAQVCQGMH